MHDYYTIVEIYGKVPVKDWDKLEVEYLIKYHNPKEALPTQSAGWISPNGKFFSCKPEGHSNLAKRISAKYFGDIENPELTLETAGWIKIHSNGVLSSRDWGDIKDVITQNQINFLHDLSEVSSGEYQDRISRYIWSVNKKDIS